MNRPSQPKVLFMPVNRDVSHLFGEYPLVENPALPNPKAVYLDTGEEVLEYSGSDFGNQPEWSKEFLAGKGLIIRGLSMDTYQLEGSTMAPARSVLYNLLEDDPNPTEPWGMFFSDLGLDEQGKEKRETSPVIKQVRSEFKRNGGRPFIVTIHNKDSEAHKGQDYWSLARYVRNVTPELDGKKGK